MKPESARDDTLIAQGAEDKIGVDRVARVAKAPSRIAEPDRGDAGLYLERPVVLPSARLPVLDSVHGVGTTQRLDLWVTVVKAITQHDDPVGAFADLAVGQARERRSKSATASPAKGLLGGVKGHASNQEQVLVFDATHAFSCQRRSFKRRGSETQWRTARGNACRVRIRGGANNVISSR